MDKDDKGLKHHENFSASCCGPKHSYGFMFTPVKSNFSFGNQLKYYLVASPILFALS
ncbi:hypothetical protein IQ13_2338 [Lacibacter cauensis]|uniref:Uncharacterized protein n=1 Tax=Lacibacter cauensis TaxID=510947 RepID=A0A562SJ89_9BACT|nr:hypothetical protein IQ13_2338 [Lacibacter cauensis]